MKIAIADAVRWEQVSTASETCSDGLPSASTACSSAGSNHVLSPRDSCNRPALDSATPGSLGSGTDIGRDRDGDGAVRHVATQQATEQGS
jgi:hypothetical protein